MPTIRIAVAKGRQPIASGATLLTFGVADFGNIRRQRDKTKPLHDHNSKRPVLPDAQALQQELDHIATRCGELGT